MTSSILLTIAIVVQFVIFMDTFNITRRPIHTNYICTSEHPGTSEYFDERKTKKLPRTQTTFKMTLKTFKKGEFIHNPITKIEMASAITNNFNLNHTDDGSFHDAIQYKISEYNLKVNINKEFSNQEKLLKKNYTKQNNNITSELITHAIDSIAYYNRRADITILNNNKHTVVDGEGIITLLIESINKTFIKQILSSLYFSRDDGKPIDDITLGIHHIEYKVTNKLNEFVNVLTKNKTGEIYPKEIAFRENYKTKFQIELLKLCTLSKDERYKYALGLEDRLETINKNQIEDYIYLTDRFTKIIFTTIKDDKINTKETKNNTHHLENDKRVLEELNDYISLQCEESKKHIKEYITEHYKRKWKEIRPQELDIFAMKDFKKDQVGKEPMFYLNFKGDSTAIAISGNIPQFPIPYVDQLFPHRIHYDINRDLQFKDTIKLFMFTVDDFSFLVSQYARARGHDTDTHCYFAGYSYKEDEDKEVSLIENKEEYFLVSKTTKGHKSLFPFDCSDSDGNFKNTDILYYLRYKEERFGSHFVNKKPIKTNLLITKNTAKFQQLSRILEMREDFMPHVLFYIKRSSNSNDKKCIYVQEYGNYFRNGNLLCELEDGSIFVRKSEPESNTTWHLVDPVDLKGLIGNSNKSMGKQKEFKNFLTFLSIEENCVVPKSDLQVEKALENNK
eukprot:GAHX01001880.1.p1 GENE.GAHX01001880.1~~GAHX01001880.1.p1  ORF type:complete len:677 (-),score=138.63 GAHX01001880.1:48-2078(-)